MNYLTRRPRRNRKNEVIRNLVEQNSLSLNDFIYPVFVLEGENKALEIASMPGIYRLSIDRMLDEIAACVSWALKPSPPSR